MNITTDICAIKWPVEELIKIEKEEILEEVENLEIETPLQAIPTLRSNHSLRFDHSETSNMIAQNRMTTDSNGLDTVNDLSFLHIPQRRVGVHIAPLRWTTPMEVELAGRRFTLNIPHGQGPLSNSFLMAHFPGVGYH